MIMQDRRDRTAGRSISNITQLQSGKQVFHQDELNKFHIGKKKEVRQFNKKCKYTSTRFPDLQLNARDLFARNSNTVFRC